MTKHHEPVSVSGLDGAMFYLDVLNSSESTEEKLAAIDAMNEEGYSWTYDLENDRLALVDLEAKLYDNPII